MGDNRRASKDSRYYGPVGASQLCGRVLVANPQD
jgi:type IV secretory pathway protease TraF